MAVSVVYAVVIGRLHHKNQGEAVIQYVSEILESVFKTTYASENQTSSTSYCPFGEVRTQTGTTPSPWGSAKNIAVKTAWTCVIVLRGRSCYAKCE